MPARTAAPPTPNRPGSWLPAALPPPVAGAPLGAHAAIATTSASAFSLAKSRWPEATPASRSVSKVLTALLTAGEPVDAACVSWLAMVAADFLGVVE